MPEKTRYAQCGECAKEFPCAPFGKLPTRCPKCKGGDAASASNAKRAAKPASNAKRAAKPAADPEPTPVVELSDEPAMLVHGLGLGFLEGNAVFHLLDVRTAASPAEKRDALQRARQFLDLADAAYAREAA
jgi:hypothetical protein